MKFSHAAAAVVAVFAFTTGAAVSAQTTSETKVTTDTSTKDGVPVKKVKVVHVQRHKTHHVKRILGVKVGHKTRVQKTVKETTIGPDGKSTSVTSTNK